MDRRSERERDGFMEDVDIHEVWESSATVLEEGHGSLLRLFKIRRALDRRRVSSPAQMSRRHGHYQHTQRHTETHTHTHTETQRKERQKERKTYVNNVF